MHVGRPAEVVPAFGRSPPAGLAGGLAGLAAGRLRTVSLVPAIPRVRFVQLPAIAALPLSASCHGRLQNRDTHVALATGRRPKKTQAKKTEKQRKKTCYFGEVEEDPAEENPIFRSAGSPHFQNGADTIGESFFVSWPGILSMSPENRKAGRPTFSIPHFTPHVITESRGWGASAAGPGPILWLIAPSPLLRRCSGVSSRSCRNHPRLRPARLSLV